MGPKAGLDVLDVLVGFGTPDKPGRSLVTIPNELYYNFIGKNKGKVCLGVGYESPKGSRGIDSFFNPGSLQFYDETLLFVR